MAPVFTREKFSEFVWFKPMTHLAKEFSLSDIALHKVCMEHDIPTSPLGWWAKAVAGKVTRTPLPAAKRGASGTVTITANESLASGRGRPSAGPLPCYSDNRRRLK